MRLGQAVRIIGALSALFGIGFAVVLQLVLAPHGLVLDVLGYSERDCSGLPTSALAPRCGSPPDMI